MVFGFGKKAPANATKKNQPTSNKRMAKYKVFKGYTPKAKRGILSRKNARNTVWELASEDPIPNDATFTAALARYQELDNKAKKTPLEEDEYNTLKLLLHYHKKTKPLAPNTFKKILPLVYTEEGLASRNASIIAAKAITSPSSINNPSPLAPNSPTVSNAGDPTNINGTIQRMKCTVCESQSIIDKALKPGEAPRKCDMCGAKAVVPSPANMFGNTNFSRKNRNNANKGSNAKAANIAALTYEPGSTNLKLPRPSGPKPNGLGNNPLSGINTNLLGKNTESAFNTPGSLNLEAMANARAANANATAKAKNNGLGNNPLSGINTNLMGKNTESAFNTPGSLNLEAMANARAANAKNANQLKNNGLGNNPLNYLKTNNVNNSARQLRKADPAGSRAAAEAERASKTPLPYNNEKSMNPIAPATADVPATIAVAPPAAPAVANTTEVQNNTLPNGWKKYTNQTNTWYVTPNGESQWEPPAAPEAEVKKNYTFPKIEGIPKISVTNSNLNKELTSALTYKLALEQTKVKDYIKKLKHARNNTKRITKNELNTLDRLEELNAKLNKKLNKGISTRKNRRNTRTSRR